MTSATLGGSMVGHRIERRGQCHNRLYNKVIMSLTAMGYTVELWHEKKRDVLTLRWSRKGSQWFVSGAGFKNINDQIETIAKNANLWVESITRDLGTESNYAVREV